MHGDGVERGNQAEREAREPQSVDVDRQSAWCELSGGVIVSRGDSKGGVDEVQACYER